MNSFAKLQLFQPIRQINHHFESLFHFIVHLFPSHLSNQTLADAFLTFSISIECQLPNLIYKLQEFILKMDHPIKTTVELSKQEKFKQLNDKLNNILKLKKIDQTKIEQSIGVKEVKPEPKKQDAQIEKIKTNKEQDQSEGEEAEQQVKGKKEQKKRKQEEKDGRVMRKAAGEVWEDKTMEDWPENDYRIFCGNLGNEVNDEILATIFRRYSSFQMARVVRDRRTGKTRGYGFVSFTNPNDFLNALKEMNGKHVGNRPVKLMKSNWKDRDLNSAKNQYLPSDFKKNSQKETHKICLDYKYVSPL